MTIDDDSNGTAERPAVSPRVPRFGAGASGLVSLLLVAGVVLVPLFGLLVAPLGLIPVLHFQSDGSPGIRAWGWVVGALVVAAVAGLGVLAVVLLAAYGLIVVIPAASVELWTRSGARESRWIAATVMAATVVILAVLLAATWPAGPIEKTAEILREGEAAAIEMYGAAGFGQAQIELGYDAAVQVVPWIFPGFFTAYLVTILFWIRPRIPLLGYRVEVAKFEEYRGDEWLAAGFAVAGLGAIFLAGALRWIALNLLIAVLLLYFVQGLAMIRAHLARWVGRGWLVRWGVALMCIMWPMPILVATLGVADSFFPMRPAASDDGGNP